MTHVKIKKKFVSGKSIITQIEIKNHSDFNNSGYDIVCAAVSSTTELVINTITQNFACECEINIVDTPPKIIFKIPFSEVMSDMDEKKYFATIGLLDGFEAHLKNIERDYPKNIRVVIV